MRLTTSGPQPLSTNPRPASSQRSSNRLSTPLTSRSVKSPPTVASVGTPSGVNVSHLLGREYIGLEEIGDGIWAVYFASVPLGWLHIDKGAILDHDGSSSRNPKLSPINAQYLLPIKVRAHRPQGLDAIGYM